MGRSTFEPKASSNRNGPGEGVMEQVMVQQSPDNSRIVVLHGEINESSVANVIVQLLHLANVNRKPIHLVVSTYGGSVDEMFSCYDTIKFLPCPVHTIALGKVMSAGILLLASGKKGDRMIGRNARLMIHPVSGGTFGNVFEVINETKEQKRLHDLMVNTLIQETKMSEKTILKIMASGHDHYIDANEAIKLGIADRIVGT